MIASAQTNLSLMKLFSSAKKAKQENLLIKGTILMGEELLLILQEDLPAKDIHWELLG